MGNSLEVTFAKKTPVFCHFLPSFSPKILVIPFDSKTIFEKCFDN